jgi:prepilin-type N-terminal cleavage/methylation domain-containing protein
MKKNSAFSLIELSIVILIIGILIAGVTQSSRLVKQFRIRTAQTMTQSSPVAGIKDLLLWYETSSDASFLSTEAQDNTAISAWNDISPQSAFKNNATQGTTANKPLYIENAFNGALPAIRFDGTNDFMLFDGSALIGSNYTIFVVEQIRASVNPGINPFISGTGTVTDANLHLGYRANTSITQAHFLDDMDYTTTGYNGTPISKIHTFWFSTSAVTGGKKYWFNGGTNTPDQANAAQTTALINYTAASLGQHIGGTTNYLNGDLAEIIIFTRALKNEERQAVETYLSKKYNIALS